MNEGDCFIIQRVNIECPRNLTLFATAVRGLAGYAQEPAQTFAFEQASAASLQQCTIAPSGFTVDREAARKQRKGQF